MSSNALFRIKMFIRFIFVLFFYALNALSIVCVCVEMLGCSPRPTEANPHEPVHHVHVWQHYFHLPHHDGVYDGVEAHSGAHVPVRQ